LNQDFEHPIAFDPYLKKRCNLHQFTHLKPSELHDVSPLPVTDLGLSVAGSSLKADRNISDAASERPGGNGEVETGWGF
jgi:hypothetical protein